MNSHLEEPLISSSSSSSNYVVNEEDLKQIIWKETKLIWRISFPAILTFVTLFGVSVVTQSFIGHIGELELSAYALVQSFLLRFATGSLMGMSSATETLCGQAFGAGHYHMLGVYLQRSWIVDGVAATAMLPMFIFTTPIFRLLGQDEHIAVAAGKLGLWCIPQVYSFVFYLTIQMYLQAQLRNSIIVWVSAGSFIINILLSYVFVYVFSWGVAGAMAAINIASWFIVLAEFVYVFGGWCSDTWKGFTMDAFVDLWPVVKLSVSSGIMMCLEVWYNSILVLLAGYMADATLAIDAFSICLNINGWESMICIGFMVAACVRVANELGRGNPKRLKLSIKTVLAISIATGLIFWVLILSLRHQISYLFTSSHQVAEAVTDLSVLLAFSVLLNSVQPVLSGVAVGAGMQGIVAYVNLGCYYGLGLPLGLLLAYVAGFQLKGLWLGMLAGVAMQTLILSIIVAKTDWDTQAKKASERLNNFLLKPEGSGEDYNERQSMTPAAA